jgi:recombination protein RecR
MADESSIELLKQAFRRLPGVGPKSAQRMVFHLLSRDRNGAREIARALDRALDSVRHCERCNNFTEHEVCDICASPKRDASQLCIVESPADLASLEQSGALQGMYFVLMGRLSPLDGIGPEQIGIPKLQARLSDGIVKEVIIATNLTVEGEATAHFIAEMARAQGVRVSRIAHGVPIGGELEYTDRVTLARALAGRREA